MEIAPQIHRELLGSDDVLIYGQCNLSLPELTLSVALSQQEQLQMLAFRSDSRKKEWLWVRYLLQTELPNHHIHYTTQGRPLLEPAGRYIAISHSSNFAAIRISPQPHIGLDVEHRSRRVSRIAHKFTSGGEWNHRPVHLAEHDFLLHLWCAKEAVYKAAHMPGLDFRRDMRLINYNAQPQSQLHINLHTPQHKHRFTLRVHEAYGHLLVWTL